MPRRLSLVPALSASLLAAVGGACLSDPTTCADGTYCRGALVCAPPAIGGCAEPGQAEVCAAPAADGDPCAYGFVSGVCLGGLCRLSGCGDGITDPARGEVCDEGDNTPGDGCSADCQSDETCGNGLIDEAVGEQCDDGNTLDHDGCQGTCVLQRCGDGVLDVLDGEVCDDGNTVDGDGCAADCRSDEACGNGVVDYVIGETCDDGNAVRGDTCDPGCAPDAVLQWDDRAQPARPAARFDHVLVGDPAHAAVVEFGGSGSERFGDTWRWRGAGEVTPLTPAWSPSARSGAAAAYHVDRREVVLFGGYGGISGTFDDTWTWDGASWRRRVTPTHPAARREHAMAFDPTSRQVVLFGGTDGTVLGDTWTWDGAAWHHGPDEGPGPRRRAVMATDPVGSDVILFGGDDPAGTLLDDTWRWRGDHWEVVEGLATSPPARRSAAMASRGVVLGGASELVLHGGVGGGGELDDTWRWDGAAWSLVDSASGSPGARAGAAMATDPVSGEVLLTGGLRAGMAIDDAWRWDGSGWTAALAAAPPITMQTMAYLPTQGTVVGLTATNPILFMTWIDGRWVEHPAGVPGSAIGGSVIRVVFDGTRLVAIVGVGAPVAQVWTLDVDDAAAAWTQQPSANGPAAASYSVATHIAGSDEIGFLEAGRRFWTWGPAGWTFQGEPGPFMTAAVADEARGEIVTLIYTAAGTRTGIWRDGALAVFEGTTPNYAAALVFDPGAQRIIAIEPGAVPNRGYDVWDGAAHRWERQPIPTMSAFTGGALVYDARQRRYFYGSGASLRPTWTLALEGRPADTCSSGLDGDGDGLVGCADPDCWAICAPLCPPGAACADDAPRCGDGTCSSIETCAACPDDCGACVGGVCGDGRCDPDEAGACPGDCGG